VGGPDEEPDPVLATTRTRRSSGDGPLADVSVSMHSLAPTEAVPGCAYIATGSYPWNAGMFITKASFLLELLREVWPGLEKIMIDHAVTEPAALEGRIAVVPTMFGMCCTLFFQTCQLNWWCRLRLGYYRL